MSGLGPALTPLSRARISDPMVVYVVMESSRKFAFLPRFCYGSATVLPVRCENLRESARTARRAPTSGGPERAPCGGPGAAESGAGPRGPADGVDKTSASWCGLWKSRACRNRWAMRGAQRSRGPPGKACSHACLGWARPLAGSLQHPYSANTVQRVHPVAATGGDPAPQGAASRGALASAAP